MIIFGHKFIESPSFYHIFDLDAIRCTPSSSTIYVDFDVDDLDIITHARLNNVPMAITVSSVLELMYASSLGAKYIVVPKKDAGVAQSIADKYLFDAKILVFITQEKEIEELAILGIDGVLFADAIVRTNS